MIDCNVFRADPRFFQPRQPWPFRRDLLPELRALPVPARDGGRRLQRAQGTAAGGLLEYRELPLSGGVVVSKQYRTKQEIVQYSLKNHVRCSGARPLTRSRAQRTRKWFGTTYT